jgi:hypothetical protein
MDFKKIVKVLSGVMLLTAVGNVFAADVVCPAPEVIRSLGTLVYAYTGGSDTWTLISQPFTYKGSDWSMKLVADLPGVKDPVEAVKRGQAFLNHSPLLPTAISNTSGSKTKCDYSKNGANYTVVAQNPPYRVGLND